MIYLLDTNAVSDVMTAHPKVTSRLGSITPADQIVISAITLGEILAGIERLPAGKRKSELDAKAQRVLPGFACEPVSEVAARRYATLHTVTTQKGTPMNDNDLWIAATALAINARLVTRDADFAAAPGLTIEDWTV